jgi:hypothetical protein
MKKRYIKPQTSVIVQQTEGPLLSGSDDGNLYGAKPWTPVGDNWRDDEQDNAPWTKQKNVWNE